MDLKTLQKSNVILIAGYGLSGKAAEAFIRKHAPAADIRIFDEEMDDCGSFELEEMDMVIRSPGFPIDKLPFSPEITTTQTEIFLASLPEDKRRKVIGITGSKGKSTTTKFCAEVLEKSGKKVAIGGNYGIPLFELYDDFIEGRYDFIVAELSSFQLEDISVSPGISIFLNLFPEHLDRHGSLDLYAKAKNNIWKFQKDGDLLLSAQKIKDIPSRCIVCKPIDTGHFPKESIFNAEHFRENLGTIWKLCDELNIDHKHFTDTARSFKGLEHRLEFFIEKNGIKFYNDSISTNPDSAIAAVSHFESEIGTLVLGGRFGSEGFEELVDTIKKKAPDTLILLPESECRKMITRCLEESKFPKEQVLLCTDYKDLVKKCFENTSPGKVCLFSPAAKSFDIFENYAIRGKDFKRLVEVY